MKNIKPPRIAGIVSIEPYKITCLFTNGQTRQIDFAPLCEEWKTDKSIAKLLDFEQFRQVSISDTQTLHWENVQVYLPFLLIELQYQPYDLDPDVLYQQSVSVAVQKNKTLV